MSGRRILALVCALLMLCPLTLAEGGGDAQARIAELEAEIAQKDARIAELEAQLAQAGEAAASSGDAAAEFDGGIVTIEDAKAEYEYRAYYYSLIGGDASGNADDIKREVLENLTEDAILEQKAREMGVYALDDAQRAELEAQAQASLDDMVTYYMQYRRQEGMTDEQVREDTLAYLAGEGYTLEGMLDSLISETWRDRLYAQVTQDVTFTDAELRAYFDESVASQEMLYSADISQYETALADGDLVLWNPAGIRAVRYVKVGFTGTNAEEYADALAKLENGADEALLASIDELFARLDPIVQEIQTRVAAGDDFMLLIDEYSADEAFAEEPARTRGAYIGDAFTGYDDAFKQAAMSLQNVGDVSEPVRGEDGVYFIQYAADVATGKVDFDGVKELLGDTALGEKKDALYNQTVEDWIAQANVRYYPERF